MNSKGYCVFADGEEYIQQSYLAALSLKASGNDLPISIITNNTIPQQYTQVFDRIIEIPWYKSDETRLKTQNRWKIYHATPYDETVVIDSDVLVLQNLNYAWNLLKNYDIYFPTRVFTYRQELVESDYYRKAFTANDLPNFYNCLHYFKKSDKAKQFFEWVELISNNWELFYGHFCSKFYPKEPSMDITAAIAAKIMDCDTEISNQTSDIISVVHMKSQIQNWKMPTSRWQDKVGVYLTEQATLKIGNFHQSGVFHYTENDFVTEDKIRKFEKCLQT
jgi:hypothetical protein